MAVGIIGAGAIAQAILGHLIRAGYEVHVSNSRGPDSLTALVQQFGGGVRAVTVREAAAADVVFVAVPWNRLEGALSGLPAWKGSTHETGKNTR